MVRYGDTTIVIPTINEEKTIGVLTRRLLSMYPGVRVIVVDDGSTDGTKRRIAAIASRNRSVSLYDRKARGLPKGLAYSMMDGVRIARTRYAVFMDGDLQHPPRVVGPVVRRLRAGYPISIAVRAKTYNPVVYRAIISSVLSVFGWFVLWAEGRASSRDIFSGYFGVDTAYARKIMERNRNRFVGDGYKFLFDLLKCIPRKDARIAEVPYIFVVRKFGSSKANIRPVLKLMKSYLT